MPVPGGIMFVTALGPPAGSEIHGTTFHVHYVSDGATPASDLHLTVGLAIDGENPSYVETVVNGSDLGFGSGPGTFEGEFSTSDLNGVTVPGFIPPYSIVDISIGAIDGGIEGTGYFVDSTINFDLVGTPTGDVDGDGSVNVADLLLVLDAWGPCDACPEDIDGDGVVDVTDVLMLLANWS